MEQPRQTPEHASHHSYTAAILLQTLHPIENILNRDAHDVHDSEDKTTEADAGGGRERERERKKRVREEQKEREGSKLLC